MSRLVPNLNEAVRRQRKNHYGIRKLERKVDKHIEKVINDLMVKLNENAKKVTTEEHFMQKIRYSRRATSSAPLNLFLVNSVIDGEREKELELAMEVCRSKYAPTKKSIAEIALSWNLSRGKARWKWAKERVSLTLRELHSKSKDRVNPGSRFNHSISMRLGSDNELKEELFQISINATRGDINSMLEARTLNQGPYQFIMAALEYQEEAVRGQLQDYPFLREKKAPATDKVSKVSSASSILDLERKDQISSSIRVAGLYLNSVLHRPKDKFMRLIQRCVGKKSRALEWSLLKRDGEVLLAYIMTLEHMVKSVEDIPSFNELLPALKSARERMVCEQLHGIMRRDPVMFAIFEHIMCALLVVRRQMHVINEFAEQGVIPEHDRDNLEKTIIEPYTAALNAYIPTQQQLQKAGSLQAHGFIHSVDVVVSFFSQFVLRPVNGTN